jgi:RHS repeat-associated protein
MMTIQHTSTRLLRWGALVLDLTSGLFAADTRYYLNDHLATTVGITDAAGEIAAIEADAFGAPLAATGQVPSRYTGKPYDEDLGAFVFPFRNYRPEEGRWMSADPSGFPDGVNARASVQNPNSQLDPLGLYTYSWDDQVSAQDKALIESGFTFVSTRIGQLSTQIDDINQNGPNAGYIPKSQKNYNKETSDLTSIISGIKSGLAGSSTLRIRIAILPSGVDATMTTYPFVSPLLTLNATGSWKSDANKVLLHELSHIQGTVDNDLKGDFRNAHNFHNLYNTDIRASVSYRFLLTKE